jgi:hypothetical protein
MKVPDEGAFNPEDDEQYGRDAAENPEIFAAEEALFGEKGADRIIDADAEDTLKGRTYPSNTVHLYTVGNEICAMIGPDPVQGERTILSRSTIGALLLPFPVPSRA